MTGGKSCLLLPNERKKIPEHAQEPPDARNDSSIPPVSDWRFLTNAKHFLCSKNLRFLRTT